MRNMEMNRREFVKAVALGATGLSVSGCGRRREALRVAVVGTGRRGRSLQRQVLALMRDGEERACPPITLAGLCDVDPERLGEAGSRALEELGRKPFLTTDYGDLLEKGSLDAVILATPNHWHAEQTRWAVEAGLAVYVEKPACHTFTEGDALRELGARGALVQVGLQNRSDIGLRAAFPRLLKGELGAIRRVRGLCYRERDSIGRRESPLVVPKGLDYEAWLGPAHTDPASLLREQLHYDWHWFWNTGGGELGNQGPHELDLIQWIIGEHQRPTEVLSFGGRFGWNDAGQTPNVQVVRFTLGSLPVYFEIRDLWVNPQTRAADHYLGSRVAVVVDCEGGQFRGGRGSGFFYDRQGRRIEAFAGDAGADHLPNFFRAVYSRSPEHLAAPLLRALPSTNLVHYGNCAHRIGTLLSNKALADRISGDPVLVEAHQRACAHLANWNLRPETLSWNASPPLPISPDSGHFKGPLAANANALLLQPHRPQWPSTWRNP